MQRLVFYPRRTERRDQLPDGHVQTTYAEITPGKETVLTLFVDHNAKRDWVVWTRVWRLEDEEWVYFDGLEFRHRRDLADEEFKRRQRARDG